MRTLPQEKEFTHFLLNLGNGSLNDHSDNIQIPKRCTANANLKIIKDMYIDVQRNVPEQERLTTSRKKKVPEQVRIALVKYIEYFKSIEHALSLKSSDEIWKE